MPSRLIRASADLSGSAEEIGHHRGNPGGGLDENRMPQTREDVQPRVADTLMHVACHPRIRAIVVLPGHNECWTLDLVENFGMVRLRQYPIGRGEALPIILQITAPQLRH